MRVTSLKEFDFSSSVAVTPHSIDTPNICARSAKLKRKEMTEKKMQNMGIYLKLSSSAPKNERWLRR